MGAAPPAAPESGTRRGWSDQPRRTWLWRDLVPVVDQPDLDIRAGLLLGVLGQRDRRVAKRVVEGRPPPATRLLLITLGQVVIDQGLQIFIIPPHADAEPFGLADRHVHNG